MMTSRIGEVTRKGNALRGGGGSRGRSSPLPSSPRSPGGHAPPAPCACAGGVVLPPLSCRGGRLFPSPPPPHPSKATFSFAPTASLRFIFRGRREFCALVFRLNARRRLLGSFARGDEACHHPQCFCVGGRARKVARHGL